MASPPSDIGIPIHYWHMECSCTGGTKGKIHRQHRRFYCELPKRILAKDSHPRKNPSHQYLPLCLCQLIEAERDGGDAGKGVYVNTCESGITVYSVYKTV
jgi:hypothetical protein